jgi:hypothetical protein
MNKPIEMKKEKRIYQLLHKKDRGVIILCQSDNGRLGFACCECTSNWRLTQVKDVELPADIISVKES